MNETFVHVHQQVWDSVLDNKTFKRVSIPQDQTVDSAVYSTRKKQPGLILQQVTTDAIVRHST